MDTSITLAQRPQTGEIVHISQAQNGLRCGCRCLECGERLEAIQGGIRTWHFRHHQNKDCLGAQETALHLAAKQIIQRNNKIMIPEKGYFQYETTSLEKRIGDYIADVSAEAPDDSWIIEIIVTHCITMQKEEYFKSNNLNAIEIDLRQVPRNIDLRKLENIVINDTSNKRVISPPGNLSQVSSDNSDHLSFSRVLLLLAIILGGRWLFRKLKSYLLT